MSTNSSGLSNEMQKVQSAWSDPTIAQRYANSEAATRPFARLLIEKSDLPTRSEPASVFDLATGTGAAVQELYDAVPKEQWGEVKVLGGDVSESMLAYLKARAEDNGWTGLSTKTIDGNKLDGMLEEQERFTHILCSFAIFVLPNALPNLQSLLAPKGFIGITTWSYLPWHAVLSDSIAKMSSSHTPPPYNPSASELESKMFSGRPWGDASYVAAQLKDAGFQRVQTEFKREKAKVGSPKLFMETMQFPLMLVKMYWPEEKREEYLEELNGVMLGEVVRLAGGEEGSVEMEFKGVCGWGWKGE
ncbi:S-adenosyl-L-methionine-dependent methyltransferase [Setomelanomma holmii]|uniref:S-adenosyl-L-methionine-dependent methyltransferase n=1 Tax=Setomelanomma holmii TaxID=210430 RepID=A0A9P4HGZ6_9PLEO|nr:S-adenosyl-L-methionine-dependent methyltransferase [Setomelanomma holmii]